MDKNSVFNLTVCIIGIAILLIHSIDFILKKDKRDDENRLFAFIVFTGVHFATYLIFTLLKDTCKSDPFIMGFYTTFYIMNNIEVLLLFLYTLSYIPMSKKVKDISSIVVFSLFVIYVILDLINIPAGIFFYAEGGKYMRAGTMFFSQLYQFVAFAVVFLLAVFNKKTNMSEKIAFTAYCLLPLIAIVIQNFLEGYAIAYLSIIVSIEMLFLFVNVKKNIALAEEERRNKEAEVKIMMSQIQPHFLYNTLASISTLIAIDPDKAQKALDDFTEYLRLNLSSLTDTSLIPFSIELKHVQTYLSLEKMRFDERLNVIYDIKTEDFLVPPLSIQPLVENAVKHGIIKKIEGGNIWIKTYETPRAYIIEIKDDGVGFDTSLYSSEDHKHVGMNNVRTRLSSMCHGELEITSEIDKGTTTVVTLYK
jgi:two-component sensor histidine kinase